MVTTSQNRNGMVCNWFYTRCNNRMKIKTTITKEMVEYWLEDNSGQWIPNVIVDICNDPSDIEHLKKQIKYDWDNKDK